MWRGTVIFMLALSCTDTKQVKQEQAEETEQGEDQTGEQVEEQIEDTGYPCDARTHPLAQVCLDNGLQPSIDDVPFTTAIVAPCDFPVSPCELENPTFRCLLGGDEHCQMFCYNEADSDTDTDTDDGCGTGSGSGGSGP